MLSTSTMSISGSIKLNAEIKKIPPLRREKVYPTAVSGSLASTVST